MGQTTYRPRTVLSSNRKTIDPSLNLTRDNCSPTKLCRKLCYGRMGPIALEHAVRKARWVSEYLKGEDIGELIYESRVYRAIRLCGNGDLLPAHVPQILKLAEECPDTIFYGFTRKPLIANSLNNKFDNLGFILSFDGTTDPGLYENYEGDMAYGPRLKENDEVPDDPRITVVFPYHFGGKAIKGIPLHPKDCPAVRGKNVHCTNCRWCYPPQYRKEHV